jgi:predicted ATP-grasp superfamily ATP-dependent carboligase
MPSHWRERSLAEPEAYLIVALSGRALALAVRRSGRCAIVLDLFGDEDMRASADASLVVAGDFDAGFDADALVAAAEALAPAASPARVGLSYAAGLEARPQLLTRLAAGRRLYGNTPETVARTKDPRTFFALLARLGIPYPEISYTMPSDPARWLTKRVGGSGGGHVEPAEAGAAPVPGCYLQRRIEGRAVGVSFLADGRRSFVLGFGEQWSSPRPGSAAHRFGGLLQPADVSRRVADAIPSALDALVGELGLVGLNSLDLIVDGDSFHVLEVNPRPGANLDIFDRDDSAGLFGWHVAACEGRLPAQWSPPPKTTAMSVLYADRALQVPTHLSWPSWVADRPAPGARIECGAPICTILAAGSSRPAVREAIAARTAFVFANLRDSDGGLASVAE